MSASKVRLALSSEQEWVGVTADKLINSESITTTDLSQIIKRATTILRLEPSLLELKQTDCRVVGNLRGNLEDLMAIFRQFGWPSYTTYVFLGDYLCLDMMGSVQISVLLMLLLFKIAYPSKILVLRGLSECEHCAADMGLIDVCCEKFSGSIYQDLVLLFKYLPLAVLVDGVYFLSCASLSLSRGYLIDYEVVDRPRTTCSQASNRLAYLPGRLSQETLIRFQDWDMEHEKDDLPDYRNLRLFLDWNGLTAVVKTADVDWSQQKCPIVEGPNNSLISVTSASSADGRPVIGAIMAIHKNTCCTFHPINLESMKLSVKMMYPDPSAKENNS